MKSKQEKENERIYKKLKEKGLTDAEIAESFVFPSERTPEQQKEIGEQLRKFREKNREQNN